ncbi:MAG: Smr/MutS family protein [Treponemataceae bacterium]|nr:Smr/MutS family protein [Treponemataceae bacterium]
MNFGDIFDAWEKQNISSGKGTKKGKGVPRQEPEIAAIQYPGASFSWRDKEAPTQRKGSEVTSSAKTPQRQSCRSSPNPRDMLTTWLDVHGIEDKDEALDRHKEEAEKQQNRRKRLLHRRPDATIDLHGCTRDEAWDALSLFFQEALRQGAEKVLIIHGKGNHSLSQAVLTRTVRQFIEWHPAAGSHGFAPPEWGGSGATWVILKSKKRK